MISSPASEREQLQALLIREAQRAGTLVSDLLAAARLDAGVELRCGPVSLAALIDADLRRARSLHPDVTFRREGDPTGRRRPDSSPASCAI